MIEDDEEISYDIDIASEYIRLKTHFEDKNNFTIENNDDITQITDHIFLSNRDQAENLGKLIENNIKYIIIFTDIPPNQQFVKMYEKSKIKTMYFSVKDKESENIGAKYFTPTYDTINTITERGENVLLACDDGISRSPTIVIAYYLKMYYDNITPDVIYEDPSCRLTSIIIFILLRRKCISPNFGFIKQLLVYEELLRKKLLNYS